MMVEITINHQKIQAEEATTILEVARDHGFKIPTFCHINQIAPSGSCRMCLVSVIFADGTRKIVSSCDTNIEEGMVIFTDSIEAIDARAEMANLLLSLCPTHPEVQKIAAHYGIQKPSFVINTPKTNCISCGNCVQICQTKGRKVIDFYGKGNQRFVSTKNGKPSRECDSCNQCIHYCPTGAVTESLGLNIGQRIKKKNHNQVLNRRFANKLFLSLFLILMLMSAAGISLSFIPNQLFSLADPFQAIMTAIAGRKVLIQYWPALVVLIMTVFLGRFWCGWICPTGTLLQSYGKNDRRIRDQNFRRFKWIFLIVFFVFAIFGSLAFLWLDPISMAIQPILLLFKPTSEYLDQGFLKTFRFVGVYWWLTALPMLFALILNFIEKRFWCRYICPLGGLLGLLSKFSLNKRHVNQNACSRCDQCSKICPTGAIDADKDYRTDPAECILCMDCADVCPKFAIDFTDEKVFQFHNEFDPGRREFVGTVLLGSAAAGLMTLKDKALIPESKNVLRPPGSLRPNEMKPGTFLMLCVRCGQCVLACPQNIIKPSILESGWEGVNTPVIHFAGSFCDPSCNACGTVCPSGAILPFTKLEKTKYPIGLAQVNYSACIRCNLCVAACPEHAFTEVTVIGREGLFPQVDVQKCSGCGKCLVVCPNYSDGAIEIYPAGQRTKFQNFPG
jgi:ferredoxin